jgi:hypothetical protein
VAPVVPQQQRLQLLKSRIASSRSSGTLTKVNCPARASPFRVSASRRSVLTRSPGFRGSFEGATTSSYAGPYLSRGRVGKGRLCSYKSGHSKSGAVIGQPAGFRELDWRYVTRYAVTRYYMEQ